MWPTRHLLLSEFPYKVVSKPSWARRGLFALIRRLYGAQARICAMLHKTALEGWGLLICDVTGMQAATAKSWEGVD